MDRLLRRKPISIVDKQGLRFPYWKIRILVNYICHFVAIKTTCIYMYICIYIYIYGLVSYDTFLLRLTVVYAYLMYLIQVHTCGIIYSRHVCNTPKRHWSTKRQIRCWSHITSWALESRPIWIKWVYSCIMSTIASIMLQPYSSLNGDSNLRFWENEHIFHTPAYEYY